MKNSDWYNIKEDNPLKKIIKELRLLGKMLCFHTSCVRLLKVMS